MRKIPHWLEELTPSESLDVLRDLAYRHAREGGAVGHQIARLIERGDFKALVEFELNYSDPAWTAHSVKSCRQALAFFQKLPDLNIGIDKEAIALQKFLEAEELCRQTNEILRLKRDGLLSWPGRVEAVFHSAQRKIARVLGTSVPSVSELDLHFGPGATRGTKRSEASIRRKLTEKLQCSEDFIPVAAMVLGEMPHLTAIHESPEVRIVMDALPSEPSLSESEEDYDWSDDFSLDSVEFEAEERARDRREASERMSRLVVDEWVSVPVEVVPARLNFVPKNAKTCRSVCVEAGLNVMFQLALGKIMAKRLAAFGVDIRDQSLNQRRALEGSLTGALATLDLSSASDTISREIVYELLPLQWATILNYGRSSKVELPDGQILTQEKFSSMGNGFTFPLETLIFWGLAAACCDRDSDATVYGDDIVIPADKFDLLREVLTYAGFVTNVQKSFSTGPFRESCGKDYFRGSDVRPFYQKGWVSAQSLFVLHNFYVRDHNDEMSKEVESFIHPDLKLWGPDGYGDGHLIGEHPERLPNKYRARGFGGYFFDTFTTKQRRDIRPIAPGDAVLPVYSIYRRKDDSNLVVPEMLRRQGVRVGLSLSPLQGFGGFSIFDVLVKDPLRDMVECAPLPLPVSQENREVKALTLPGVDGYKKITVYTLGK